MHCESIAVCPATTKRQRLHVLTVAKERKNIPMKTEPKQKLSALALNGAYDCINRVERVTRWNSRKTEDVRIVFQQFGRERVLTLTPEWPAMCAEERLAHCPRLTSRSHHRLKRDHTLLAAREMGSYSSSASPQELGA